MTTTESDAFNIKEASHATGLTPSVLRIWELRYGWPKPRRKANGYRTYQRHQIDDLCKVASLVKSGQPISSIIIDGLPRWPAAGCTAPSPRLLPITRAPAGADAAAGGEHTPRPDPGIRQPEPAGGAGAPATHLLDGAPPTSP